MVKQKSAQSAKVVVLSKGKLVKFVFERSCLRKKSFSRNAADAVVDRFAEKGELIFYYKCQFCNSYHMTKRSDEVKRRIEVV